MKRKKPSSDDEGSNGDGQEDESAADRIAGNNF